MVRWTADVQEIFDAIHALCVDKSSVGEYERSIQALNEIWRQYNQLTSLNLRVSIDESMEHTTFNAGSTPCGDFTKTFWKMYQLVLERAQADPQVPKDNFSKWM